MEVYTLYKDGDPICKIAAEDEEDAKMQLKLLGGAIGHRYATCTVFKRHDGEFKLTISGSKGSTKIYYLMNH